MVIIMTVLLGAQVAFADSENTGKSINIRTDALLLAGGNLNGEVDFKLGRSFTVGPMVGTRHASASIAGLDIYKESGLVAAARGNWYLSGEALQDSFIVSPILGMGAFTYEALDTKVSQTGLYGALMLSYQMVWKSGLNVNAGAGMNYLGTGGSDTEDVAFVEPIYSGLRPTIEVTLGYAI